MSFVTRDLDGVAYTLRASPPSSLWSTTLPRYFTIVATLPVSLPLGLLWTIIVSFPCFRNRCISWCVPRAMKGISREFAKERQALLSRVGGKVLDVGSGGGAYLKHCSRADLVVALEPVSELHPKIREAGASVKELHVVSRMEDIPPEEQFDWIILGNVLCEVACVHETLRQVNDRLKPGGMVYFSEHIANPQSSWQRRFQNMVNPWWRHVSGGCNCNRDTLDHIQSQDWATVHWIYYHLQLVFVVGLAQKNQ